MSYESEILDFGRIRRHSWLSLVVGGAGARFVLLGAAATSIGAVVRGDMSPISLSNAAGDTFLLGVSVSECGNLYSQINSHIIQLALLAIVKIR